MIVSGIESQRARENATRLAATQVNEQGGLDGHLFGFVFCDVAEDPKYDSLKRADAVVASGRYLADVIGAQAFVGPSSSPDVAAVFKALDKDTDKGVLIISPSATSPELTGLDVQQASDDTPGLLWRTAVPDTVQGSVIARHLETFDPPVTNVNVVFEKGAYGEGLESVFRKSFEKAGRTITSHGFTAGNSGERDQAIFDGGQGNPQYVLFFSSQSGDQSSFVIGINGLSAYQTVKIFLSDTAANVDLLKNAAQASAVFPRIIGTRPSIPAGSVYDRFKFSYNAAFKQDPSPFTFVPHAYDATWMVFAGTAFSLRHEQTVTGRGIARGLRRVASGGDLVDVAPNSWARIRDDFGNDKAVNLVGASGNLDYDPSTEETKGDIDIWKISTDGQQIEFVTKYSP
jgi:branched-chain amino acid transport system substrate-binding protein